MGDRAWRIVGALSGHYRDHSVVLLFRCYTEPLQRDDLLTEGFLPSSLKLHPQRQPHSLHPLLAYSHPWPLMGVLHASLIHLIPAYPRPSM